MIIPSLIIAELLKNEGIFTDPDQKVDWPVFVTHMPDGKFLECNLGTVYDTAPIKDGRLQSSGKNILHFGIQLCIRSEEYDEGYEKALEVTDYFETISNEEIEVDSVNYSIKNISQVSGILSLNEEGIKIESTKRRQLFTVNFLATIKEV